MKKGSKHSLESIIKMVENRSGIKNPNFGKLMSQTQKDKISRTCKERGVTAGKNNPMFGRKRPDVSERNKNTNMSGKNNPMFGLKGSKHPKFGTHLSSKQKENIRRSLIGKSFTDEHKRRLRENHADFSGKNHPQWRGGVSFEDYSSSWNEKLKKDIRERDNHICQICFNIGNYVHHIDYNKKNCKPKNLVTLCFKCHMKTNFGRERWEMFFKKWKICGDGVF